MTHVTLGVIYLGVIAWGFGGGRFNAEDVEVSGLYWHFVDLVLDVYLSACLSDVKQDLD